MFNPLTHKVPYGASAVGQKTEFYFPLPASYGAEKVFVIARKGEHELRAELPFSHFSGDDHIYAGSLVFDVAGVWKYRFEAKTGNGTVYFGRASGGDAIAGEWLPEWQMTVSERQYKTPNWAKDGVMYQIFADRFARAGEVRFAKRHGRIHSDWYDLPDIAEEGQDYRADDFFGGNAEGIVEKLPYLKSLGVTAIYLTPVFLSSSNHRYDTADYMEIDDLFGGEKGFRRLIAEAAKEGISVVLDGVFNHTGADSVYFNKFGTFEGTGAYQSKKSPYYGWYTFFDYPDDYHCWWGSTVVPTVNKSAEGYRELICGKRGAVAKWTAAGVRGWRLDVVDELPTDFTDLLCASIRRENPDCLVVGEVWEDASDKMSYGTWRPYFMGNELDGVMNYPFRRAIFDLILRGDREAFREGVTLIAEHYPKESLDVCLTLLGSHDTVRALTALSGADAPFTKEERRNFRLSDEFHGLATLRLKAASILQYTLPGIPCVYYGDEAGMQGFEDPLNRGTYPWGRENDDLLAHYKALGVMRARNKRALTGRLRFVEDGEITVYERISDDGADILRVWYNPCLHAVWRDVDAYDAFTGEEVGTVCIPPLSAYVSCNGGGKSDE